LLAASARSNSGVPRSIATTRTPFTQCSMDAPRTTMHARFHSPAEFAARCSTTQQTEAVFQGI
jgi:hypothetical protein